MTQIITRLYSNAADAAAAVKDLKAHKFGDDEIFVVGPPASGDASVDSIALAIQQAAILRKHAAILAQGVEKGGTVVTVHAPFGAAGKATGLLDKNNPIPSGVEPPVYPRVKWENAAPFSSSFRWPTLLKDPAPFSSFWSAPTLANPDVFLSSTPGLLLISNSPAPLSKRLGLALLSDNPTPLSSALRLKVLKK